MKFRAILTSTVGLTLGLGLLAASRAAPTLGEAAPDVPAAFQAPSAVAETPGAPATVAKTGTDEDLPAAVASAPAAAAPAMTSWTKSRQDVLLGDMAMAYKKLDRRRMAELLPQVRGHALEIWATYWDLSARLEDAKPPEIEAFLNRYAGSYLEDRLRNDWLLILGKRRDWTRFEAEYAKFRMHDDPEVRCHALHATYAREAATPRGIERGHRPPGDGSVAGSVVHARRRPRSSSPAPAA